MGSKKRLQGNDDRTPEKVQKEKEKDPLQKEKGELADWLKESISSLKTNTSYVNPDNKDNTSEENRQNHEMSLFHIESLETISRLLENECLEVSKVRELKSRIDANGF